MQSPALRDMHGIANAIRDDDTISDETIATAIVFELYNQEWIDKLAAEIGEDAPIVVNLRERAAERAAGDLPDAELIEEAANRPPPQLGDDNIAWAQEEDRRIAALKNEPQPDTGDAGGDEEEGAPSKKRQRVFSPDTAPLSPSRRSLVNLLRDAPKAAAWLRPLDTMEKLEAIDTYRSNAYTRLLDLLRMATPVSTPAQRKKTPFNRTADFYGVYNNQFVIGNIEQDTVRIARVKPHTKDAEIGEPAIVDTAALYAVLRFLINPDPETEAYAIMMTYLARVQGTTAALMGIFKPIQSAGPSDYIKQVEETKTLTQRGWGRLNRGQFNHVSKMLDMDLKRGAITRAQYNAGQRAIGRMVQKNRPT
jgi:hypothetical protein